MWGVHGRSLPQSDICIVSDPSKSATYQSSPLLQRAALTNITHSGKSPMAVPTESLSKRHYDRLRRSMRRFRSLSCLHHQPGGATC